jgi:hypothetical protein
MLGGGVAGPLILAAAAGAGPDTLGDTAAQLLV